MKSIFCRRQFCFSEAKSLKQYIENNSNCTLLSTEYENVNALMNLRCECGEKFQTTFKLFKQGKKQCNKCDYKNSNKNRK